MSRKGGYIIVDLKGTPFETGTGQTVNGVYEHIEGNYRKPVLLSGINIDGTEYADMYIAPTVSGSDYTASVYGKTMTVTSENLVTFANS